MVRNAVWSLVVLGGLMGGVGCAGNKTATEAALQAEQPKDAEAQQKARMCGGFAGLPCPEPLVCVDDPSDSCDPKQGGADCSGICQQEGDQNPQEPRCDDKRRHYVARSPEECMRVRFACPPPGEENADKRNFFSDACGCGCEST
ncbi:hypothetical protein [Archangium primigenium]|uniref:hypothetical protein n=1 Tax=[Archangium] primigenium TaxID=2792470 RepID=UPI00195DC4A5|nr:hypothetical protein [Archangium primigenium]MBM7117319.1 hypothetical protein [Archangium primigenium]